MEEKYQSFDDLSKFEAEGRDYKILACNEGSPVVIIAPHGGKIEPGTTELAQAIAGDSWGFYSFLGLKEKNNFVDLHITSVNFDEPKALAMVTASQWTMAIHGCGGGREEVYLGGLDTELRNLIKEALSKEGFYVSEHIKYLGESPDNICNKNQRAKGIQLEITSGLRKLMFTGYKETNIKTPVFEAFVKAMKAAISKMELRKDEAMSRMPER